MFITRSHQRPSRELVRFLQDVSYSFDRGVDDREAPRFWVWLSCDRQANRQSSWRLIEQLNIAVVSPDDFACDRKAESKSSFL